MAHIRSVNNKRAGLNTYMAWKSKILFLFPFNISPRITTETVSTRTLIEIECYLNALVLLHRLVN